MRSDGSIAVSPKDQPAPNGNDFVAIAAGLYLRIALRKDGSIVSWGQEGGGLDRPPPGRDFVAIAAGLNLGLALKSDGSVVAWGPDFFGQLRVPPGHDFVAIAGGNNFAIAQRSDGSIVAWGDDSSGITPRPPGRKIRVDHDEMVYRLRPHGSTWGPVGGRSSPAGRKG